MAINKDVKVATLAEENKTNIDRRQYRFSIGSTCRVYARYANRNNSTRTDNRTGSKTTTRSYRWK